MALKINLPAGQPNWLNTNIGLTLPTAAPFAFDNPGNPNPTATTVDNPVLQPIAGAPYKMKARIINDDPATPVGDHFVHFYTHVASTILTDTYPVGQPVKISTPQVANQVIPSSSNFFPLPLNDGHFCMLVAITTSTTRPNEASLNPNAQGTIAQYNFSGIPLKPTKMFMMAFQIGIPLGDQEDEYTVEMAQAPTEELVTFMGLTENTLPLRGIEGRINNFGILPYNPCLDRTGLRRARPMLEGITAEKDQRRAVMMAGMLEGDAAFVHIIQRRRDGEVVGGLSALVYQPIEERRPRKDYSAS